MAAPSPERVVVVRLLDATPAATACERRDCDQDDERDSGDDDHNDQSKSFSVRVDVAPDVESSLAMSSTTIGIRRRDGPLRRFGCGTRSITGRFVDPVHPVRSFSVSTRIDPERSPPEIETALSHIAVHMAVCNTLPTGTARWAARKGASPAVAHERIRNR